MSTYTTLLPLTTPSPLPPPSPPHLTYVNFGVAVTTLALELGQVFLWLRFLYCTRYRPQRLVTFADANLSGGGGLISSSLLLFVCTHVVNCLASMPYHCYVVFGWHPPDPDTPLLANGAHPTVFSVDIMFWLGLWTQNYMATLPFAVFILTADRFLIHLHLKYRPSGSKTSQAKFITCATAALVGIYCGSTMVNLMELPLNRPATTACENFSCLALKYRTRPQLLAKLAVGSANVVVGIAFLYRLHNSTSALNVVSVWSQF